MSGAVDLPALEQPPEPLWGLLAGTDARSRAFRQGIRLYNSAFNMASSTAKVERRFPDGVQAFRINGVVHHPGECLHNTFHVPWFSVWQRVNRAKSQLATFAPSPGIVPKSCNSSR